MKSVLSVHVQMIFYFILFHIVKEKDKYKVSTCVFENNSILKLVRKA
jgi:hypothetical protein